MPCNRVTWCDVQRGRQGLANVCHCRGGLIHFLGVLVVTVEERAWLSSQRILYFTIIRKCLHRSRCNVHVFVTKSALVVNHSFIDKLAFVYRVSYNFVVGNLKTSIWAFVCFGICCATYASFIK